MAISSNIIATYRGPGRVMRKLLALGVREDRALAYLMGACLVMFVAQWPKLARQAHISGEELDALLGANLMGFVFVAPLVFYIVAGIARGIGRLLGGSGTGYGARMALFWALLAACPLQLLYGLTSGFIGPGVEATGVYFLWSACFMWFWIGGSLAQERAT
jgi:hypothetical protein